jgi:hypothetical protein
VHEAIFVARDVESTLIEQQREKRTTILESSAAEFGTWKLEVGSSIS